MAENTNASAAERLLWMESWQVEPTAEAAFLDWTRQRLSGAPDERVVLREIEQSDNLWLLVEGSPDRADPPAGDWSRTSSGEFRQVYPADGPPPPLERPLLGALLVGLEAKEARNVAEFSDWYDTEHLPWMGAIPGIPRIRRYTALENPGRSLAIYELSDLAAIETDAWHGGASTPWSTRMRKIYQRWLPMPRKRMLVVPLDQS
jgi:hypothetical protein